MQALANDETAMVDTKVAVAYKLLQGGVKVRDRGGSPSKFGRKVTEESSGN